MTLLGTTRALPQPFFVLASQNPIELEGTYPLPEAQLDRFLFRLLFDQVDVEVLDRIITERRRGELPLADWQMEPAELEQLYRVMDRIYLPRPVARYIARLVAATHPGAEEATDVVNRYVSYGASPRAAIAIAEAARGHALVDGRPSAGLIYQLPAREQSSGSIQPYLEALDHIKEANAELWTSGRRGRPGQLYRLDPVQNLRAPRCNPPRKRVWVSYGNARRARSGRHAQGREKLEEGLIDLASSRRPPVRTRRAGSGNDGKAAALHPIQQGPARPGHRQIGQTKADRCQTPGRVQKGGAMSERRCPGGFPLRIRGDCESFSLLAASYCRGGIDRGRGDAPMTLDRSLGGSGRKISGGSPAAVHSVVGCPTRGRQPRRARPERRGRGRRAWRVGRRSSAGWVSPFPDPCSHAINPPSAVTSRGRNRTWRGQKGRRKQTERRTAPRSTP